MMNPPESETPTIVVIEDEAAIRKFLRISLEAHGYRVEEARLGADGILLCTRNVPDLVILDLGLPDMDGKNVIARLRDWSRVPIVVLSVRSDEQQKVAALDAGANDFVTKPFGISELLARLRVLLRNRDLPNREEAVYSAGGLRVDLGGRRVFLAGQETHLTPKEFNLLRVLVRNRGSVLTHQQLLTAVWGPDGVAETQNLRVLVAALRHKLGEDPSSPRYVVTEPGVGYRFGAEQAD